MNVPNALASAKALRQINIATIRCLCAAVNNFIRVELWCRGTTTSYVHRFMWPASIRNSNKKRFVCRHFFFNLAQRCATQPIYNKSPIYLGHCIFSMVNCTAGHDCLCWMKRMDKTHGRYAPDRCSLFQSPSALFCDTSTHAHADKCYKLIASPCSSGIATTTAESPFDCILNRAIASPNTDH